MNFVEHSVNVEWQSTPRCVPDRHSRATSHARAYGRLTRSMRVIDSPTAVPKRMRLSHLRQSGRSVVRKCACVSLPECSSLETGHLTARRATLPGSRQNHSREILQLDQLGDGLHYD